MNFTQNLSSRKFFIFNLVLIGAIFGFSLAFLSFSCSTSGGRARAQESAPVEIPQDALAVAESLQNAFNAVSERVLPSVVEIITTIPVQQQSQSFNGIPWEFFFGPQGDSQGQGQGQERERFSQALGTGIVVRHDRDTYYAVTNYHVVEEAREITVTSQDGKEYPATLVGTDTRRDLAVVSFKTNDVFPVAVLGNSDEVKVGDWSIAMGNPLGTQFAFSVTMGIVSAVGRENGPTGNINDFIQTDAPINQGNSGGPLVNIRGEIIGINTWIASNNGGGSVGLGFAIPINNAKRSIDELIRSGTISDGWLGVSMSDLDRETMQALDLGDRRGAFAYNVFLNSPAYKGGIRPGDYITAIDGREVRSANSLTQMVGNLRPGDSAVFTVFRDGIFREFTVRIETRTDEVAADSKNLWPGLTVVALTDSVRSSLRLDSNAQGLYVNSVTEETPAYIIGMRRGDRITHVNDTPVRDMLSFYRALRENTDQVWFTFIRGDSTLESARYRR